MLLASVGPLVTGYTGEDIDLVGRLAPPSLSHLLGTDAVGRDVLTRLLLAGRVSIGVALVAVVLALPLGTLLGLVSGYVGSWADAVVMRITDALLSVPLFLLVLVLLATLEPSTPAVVIVIGLTIWMGIARLVRAEVLRTLPLEYILAARVIGASGPRIALRHVLPAVAPAVIVAGTVTIPAAILLEASLGYFGLGVQPPTPSWGNMLGDSQNYIWNVPTLAVWPGLAILVTVLTFNRLGEHLRIALDPYEASL